MKKIILTIALCACTTLAYGQFVAGALARNPVAVPTTGYLLDKSIHTTNVASPVSVALTGAGLKFYALVGCTNNVTSNVVFRFQVSADATTWMNNVGHGTEAQLSTTLLLAGIGASTIYTNIFTEAQEAGIKYIRLQSISNATFMGGVLSNNLWVTNMYFMEHAR